MTDDNVDDIKPNKDEPKTEIVTLSTAEYANLQKQMGELQAANDGLVVEKETIARNAVMVELTALNPTLAANNKEADLAKLEIVLQVAKEMKAEFPPLKTGSQGSEPKNELNVGAFNADKNEWLI